MTNVIGDSPESSPIAGIFCADTNLLSVADSVAQSLALPILTGAPENMTTGQFVVVVDHRGLSLYFTGRKSPGPVYVDFVTGAAAHRRRFGGGKGQLIAKAIGIKGAYRPIVTDLTAGLGNDGFVLASLGCQVNMVERVPLIFQLLQDGIERARSSDDLELKAIISRLSVSHQESINYLDSLEEPCDVIYLDPMFPEREKSAQVKKSMLAFQSIVGGDTDAGDLLSRSLLKTRYRVVVKRPRKAPSIDQQYPDSDLPKPGLVLAGKSSRFDIYPLSKMP
ncbi:MAG: class I SAM-dependent methyltransferase [Cellvibrionaceae bacterium]